MLGGGGGGGFFGGGVAVRRSSSSNSYDPMEDYGRAAFDVRNRGVIGGTISLPYAFRLSPFILANSGAPFNIIVGQDLNGDSIFNDRPALASTPGSGGVIKVTPYGTFNTVPIPGQPITPINYGTGPELVHLESAVEQDLWPGAQSGEPQSCRPARRSRRRWRRWWARRWWRTGRARTWRRWW